MSKNLFETYEVNGKQYTDNLPPNSFISISKKQYIEYEQQKEEIDRLNKCYCNRSDCSGRLNQKNEVYDSVVQRNKKAIEYIEKEFDIEKICRQEKSLTICKKDLLNILRGDLDGIMD